jgi:hypothetical protein
MYAHIFATRALDAPAVNYFRHVTNNISSCYYDAYRNYRCTNGRSTWNSWARWLVLGLIILGILFVFFLFS